MLWLNIDLDLCLSASHHLPHFSPMLSFLLFLSSLPSSFICHRSFLPQLFSAITGSVHIWRLMLQHVWCCCRHAVPARGGGLSGSGNSAEEPVHWLWHAPSATRGRPCQQVRTLLSTGIINICNTIGNIQLWQNLSLSADQSAVTFPSMEQHACSAQGMVRTTYWTLKVFFLLLRW